MSENSKDSASLETIAKSFVEKTMFTLDTRSAAWGVERIVLDGISNHLDAGKTDIFLWQNGRWTDYFNDADPSLGIEQIAFGDDGSGYSYKLLTILSNMKTEKPLMIGQFGEGLKMMAAACLREGIGLKYQSRDWRAIPFTKDEQIDGLRFKQLCFKIETGREPSPLSALTWFTRVTPELVREVWELPYKILPIADRWEKEGKGKIYRELFREQVKERYAGRIITLEDRPNSFYVKGVKVQDAESIFSYDLSTDGISPDRREIERFALLREMREILEKCDNKTVIERILQQAYNDPGKEQEEYDALYSGRFMGKTENLFTAIFYEIYGKDAILASTNSLRNEGLFGYKTFRFHPKIAAYLKAHGIKHADDITDNESRFNWIKPEELTKNEHRRLEYVARVLDEVTSSTFSPKIKVFEDVHSPAGEPLIITGVASKEESECIGISRQRLNAADNLLVTTILHECGHLLASMNHDVIWGEYGYRLAGDYLANILAKDK